MAKTQEIQEWKKNPRVRHDYHEEVTLITEILYKHKIYDMVVGLDINGVIIAKDPFDTWKGKDLYDFLYHDLFVYNEDGSIELLTKEEVDLLEKFKRYHN